MTDWTAFALATVVLTILLLVATHRSARTLERLTVADNRSGGSGDGASDSADDVSQVDPAERSNPTTTTSDPSPPKPESSPNPNPAPATTPTITTTALLANVLLSQAIALAALVGIAWWAGVPAHAFGIERGDFAGDALLLGVAAGVGLYVANEAAAGLGKRFGMAAPERLRAAMAPDDVRGWTLLLGVVLPVIAIFEEALFRGALIGAFALGFGADPWLLAVLSSVAFGLGHGAQGRLGVLVTSALGLVLAALFVLTGSLLLVIVAHYVINALEFVVREGLGRELWGDS